MLNVQTLNSEMKTLHLQKTKSTNNHTTNKLWETADFGQAERHLCREWHTARGYLVFENKEIIK
jgi:hypothetical protein